MATQQQRTIGFIGAGNMPRSIIGGMIKGGFPASNIWASNRSRPKLDDLEKDFGIQTTQDNNELVDACDVIVMSVKPQMMKDVCADLKANAKGFDGKLVTTVAAGIPIEKYYTYLGDDIKVIRIMPNTPSLVGKGVSGLVADSRVTEDDKAFIDTVFGYVGITIWLEEEASIDVLGAVAGSGPAYFFEFMHGLQAAAQKLGFDEETARAMVQQTCLGAAEMASESELSLVELRKQVTSKGGSTAKGVEAYQDNDLNGISEKAVRAAVARNQEMAKLF
ncbi:MULTISPECIES: pyrroline-5-carboxylate reductase [Gammaproteobacteria]|uniref:pyrroline-5-carboxylate reductase n=1 Tax=Gammaproteobacteria TaxID=1236 RepID=UPI000DCF76CB|nr:MULTISPECIES: pyrroline-5-carboxylate reductase [Gammaproteobacteria]RTE87710.1 pyrroline-5-carboxylate reductase [Aliidiomarina sp. B3213]TCZ92507.1 pyrroline-5-carboxylate reductase [Lysobacter sp. N42]